MVKYVSTKRYGHEQGFTTTFRQHRADSHCRYMHGYALAFEFTFESEELDVRNWVVDFGSLKSLKGQLEHWFDHTTIVAEDDPEMEMFELLAKVNLIQLRKMPSVGCEKVAEFAWHLGDIWLLDNGYHPRVKLRSVQVWEHGNNSARYEA